MDNRKLRFDSQISKYTSRGAKNRKQTIQSRCWTKSVFALQIHIGGSICVKKLKTQADFLKQYTLRAEVENKLKFPLHMEWTCILILLYKTSALVGSEFGGTWEDPGGGFIKFAVKRALKQDQTLHMEEKLQFILYFSTECAFFSCQEKCSAIVIS